MALSTDYGAGAAGLRTGAEHPSPQSMPPQNWPALTKDHPNIWIASPSAHSETLFFWSETLFVSLSRLQSLRRCS
jgi:hypothetical protein